MLSIELLEYLRDLQIQTKNKLNRQNINWSFQLPERNFYALSQNRIHWEPPPLFKSVCLNTQKGQVRWLGPLEPIQIGTLCCQAQPQPQLQLQLGAELFIFSADPPTHPPGRVLSRPRMTLTSKAKMVVLMVRL